MSTALELRRAHWAPRNAIARAAGLPEPEPRRRPSRAFTEAMAVGLGDLDAPWRRDLIAEYTRKRGGA